VDRFSGLIEKVLAQMNNIEELSKTLIDYGRFHHSFGAEQKYATVRLSTIMQKRITIKNSVRD